MDLEFISSNEIFLVENEKINEFDYYKGRSAWDMFSMHVHWEFNYLDYCCSNKNCYFNKIDKLVDIDGIEQKICFQLDHINGIRSDNRISNLRFLCPECHSHTPTYKVNKKKEKDISILHDATCNNWFIVNYR